MDCQEVKIRIADFLSGALPAAQADDFREHVGHCPLCAKEVQAFQEAWKSLEAWTDEEPEPGYISRFWTRLTIETPWHEKLFLALKPIFLPQRLVPGLVTLCTIFILAHITVSQMRVRETEKILTMLSQDDVEMVENLDVIEQMDMLEDLDFLQDLDVIVGLSGPEA